jgi:glycosyltransferase 2 family protein
VSILIFIFSRASLDELVARVKAGAPGPLVAALLVVLLAQVLVALRWRLLAAALGLAVPVGLAVRAVFQGLLASQLLPSTLGADLVRGWMVARYTGAARRAASSVVADRLAGLFGACLLLATAYGLFRQLPIPFAGYLAAAAPLASGAAFLASIVLLARVDGMTPRPAAVLAAVALALVIHSLNVASAALAAQAYGANPALEVWLSIIPVALIAVAVPVSINGWGVREAVIVALAAGHGIPAADALAVALTLGLLNLAAGLPGAYFLWSAAR